MPIQPHRKRFFDYPAAKKAKMEETVGTKEILYDGYYYNVTDFIKRHPGGKEIMNFFTGKGENATIPIQQFHSRSMNKVLGIMSSLDRRPQQDENISEIIDQKTRERNKALTEDFTKLYLELKAEGLFEPSYPHIAYRLLEMFAFAVIGFYVITHAATISTKGLGCIILWLAQIRALGVMHESGHLSLTGNPKVDRLVHTFTFGSFFGISPIFWRRHHSFHHAQTSRAKYDVDVETLPLICINMKIMDDPKKDQNFIIRNQIFFSPFVVLLYVGYLQFWDTAKNLLKYRIPSELLAIGIYYVCAWHIGFWHMVVITFLSTVYFGVNTSINHSFLPVSTEPSHWVEQSLCHTVNIKKSLLCDWWMIYLNFQIEHHLFPTMPQFRNRLAVDRVKALAYKHGLPYHVLSYTKACWKSIINVYDISKEVKKLNKEHQ